MAELGVVKSTAEMDNREWIEEKYNLKGITSAELDKKEFPDPNYVIKDMIPEGLTLLYGSPKSGKSWLALQLASSVSVGTKVFQHFDAEPGKVLYVAYEDTGRRLKKRRQDIGALPSLGLVFYEGWPPGPQGVQALDELCELNPETKLIIIDTLINILPPETDLNDYGQVYAALDAIKGVSDRRGVSIIAIHHAKKGKGATMVDAALGSTALTAAVDTFIHLERHGARCSLRATGRDIDDWDIAMELVNGEGWKYLGEGDEFRTSETQNAILEVLKDADEPLSPKDIAAMADEAYGTVRTLLGRMVNNGVIHKPSRGRYCLRE